MNINDLDIKHRNQLLFDAHNDRRQKLLGYPDIPEKVMVRESIVNWLGNWFAPLVFPSIVAFDGVIREFTWNHVIGMIVLYVIYLFAIQPDKKREKDVVLDLNGIHLSNESYPWSQISKIERFVADWKKGFKNSVHGIILTVNGCEVIVFTRGYNYQQSRLEYLLFMFKERSMSS